MQSLTTFRIPGNFRHFPAVYWSYPVPSGMNWLNVRRLCGYLDKSGFAVYSTNRQARAVINVNPLLNSKHKMRYLGLYTSIPQKMWVTTRT